MKKLCRNALLSILTILPIHAVSLFVTPAHAAAAPADAIGQKKNKKYRMKKIKTKKILKGRHNSHKHKPA